MTARCLACGCDISVYGLDSLCDECGLDPVMQDRYGGHDCERCGGPLDDCGFCDLCGKVTVQA